MFSAFVVTLSLFGAGIGPAQAQTPADACAADKVEAAGQYMDAALDCERRGANGEGEPGKCVLRASRRLAAAFASIERGGRCAVTGDADAVVSGIDASISGVMNLLDGSGDAQCMKHLVTAMGTNAEAQLACYADAVAKGAGHSVDSACQANASRRFFEAFDRVAAQRDCGAVDAPAIDAAIRRAASSARSAVAFAKSTCAPIEVTAFHGTHFQGNSRLSRIENGRVPCVHVDDATPASCAFSTVAGRQSGEWLESPDGQFALVGQAVRLDGTPGGDYIVAAAVSSTAPARCVEPGSMDTLGVIMQGMELAPTCTIEQPGADYNAHASVYPYWSPLVNYADREVCTANDPANARTRHPDGAALVRSYSSSGTGPHDTFCYAGWGAALNDINGTERDELGNYYDHESYCHYMEVGGFTVPAAKRPATFSFPGPGVNTRSTLRWRPANPHVVIANGFDPATPVVELFYDKAAFLAATAAIGASGPVPDLGEVTGSTTLGTITLSLAPGGDTLFVGAAGTGAAPDWYPPSSGHDIALGYENLQAQTSNPVYSIGFDFVEPNVTMPPAGGTPVDSVFDIVLYLGAAEVGRTSFNAVDDVVGFIGVWSNRPFDRVTIIDRTGNDDDEYFGKFYTGFLIRR